MIISLIAAASTNNVIGKNNQLPWYLPVDLKFLKNTTWGMPVIMGRKTLESNGNKPLRGRINIIMTTHRNINVDGVVAVNNWSDALFVAKDADCKEVFVIGGGVIFREVIHKADRIYMTRVHAIIDGDVSFPEIDEKKWKKVSNRDCFADERHKYNYSFQLWEKQ